MKALHLFAILSLAFFGAFVFIPAHADDALINEAQSDLQKAWGVGGDAPSNADRITLLNSALDLLKKVPPIYHGQRFKAIGYIQSALLELQKGDPDQKATDYIHSAVEVVRDMSGVD